MCYPDGSPEAAGYNDDRLPASAAAAIPQTYDCGHDDYFNPDPAAGSYLDTHWNVYTSAFMGACAQARDGVRRQHRPHASPVNTALPAVAGAAAARRACSPRARGPGSTARRAYALQWQRAAGARLGEHPGRDGDQLRGHRRRRRRRPARGRHGDQRGRLGDRGLGRRRRRSPRSRRSRPPQPKPVGAAPACSIALRDHAHHAKGTLAATRRRRPGRARGAHRRRARSR